MLVLYMLGRPSIVLCETGCHSPKPEGILKKIEFSKKPTLVKLIMYTQRNQYNRSHLTYTPYYQYFISNHTI